MSKTSAVKRVESYRVVCGVCGSENACDECITDAIAYAEADGGEYDEDDDIWLCDVCAEERREEDEKIT